MRLTVYRVSIAMLLTLVGILTLASCGEGLDTLDSPKRVTRSSGDFVKPSQEELRSRLDDLQYNVTQENGTEPPYRNKYWNNKEEGIYVDIVSGEPLFHSKDKFDSGTGWPCFSRPLYDAQVFEQPDTSHGMVRREVRSSVADSHLGHVFQDSRTETRQRYCINSAALRFIPKSQLVAEGYPELVELFEQDDREE